MMRGFQQSFPGTGPQTARTGGRSLEGGADVSVELDVPPVRGGHVAVRVHLVLAAPRVVHGRQEVVEQRTPSAGLAIFTHNLF